MSTAQTFVELYCCRLRTDVGHEQILPRSSSGTILMSTHAAEGAARETWEEARARVSILAPYAHYDIPRIGQVRHDPPGGQNRCILRARQTLTCSSSHPVTLRGAEHRQECWNTTASACSCSDMLSCCQAYLLFRAALAEPYTFGAGSESLDVQLVAPEDIQWEEVRAQGADAVLPDAGLLLRGSYCLEATQQDVEDGHNKAYLFVTLLCIYTRLQIAFSSISLALRAYIADMGIGRLWHSHHAVI